MNKTSVGKILKLGMAIRYLYMIKAGEPMYGKSVRPNIDKVLGLLDEFKFTANERINTLYGKLSSLKTELDESRENNVKEEQAAKINEIAGDLRSAVYSYGDTIDVCDCNLAIPDKITLKWLAGALQSFSIKQLFGTGVAVVGFIGMVFALGHKWNAPLPCEEIEPSQQPQRCITMSVPEAKALKSSLPAKTTEPSSGRVKPEAVTPGQ